MAEQHVLALWGLLAVVSLATYVWRATGVVIAARITPDGRLSQWFTCVAYGMLAGLISRIMLMPVGILAHTPLVDRLVSLGCGFALFVLFRRAMLPGVVGAVGVFIILAALRGYGIL
ncbi:MAG: AzlD domain-containing protein [Rhodospirillales bacterium]